MARRNILRLLRFRNLVIFIMVVILLYRVKLLLNFNRPKAVYLSNSNAELTREDVFKPEVLHKIEGLNEFEGVLYDPMKIDWHDYLKIYRDNKRVGIGEKGVAAQLPESLKKLEVEMYAVNGFNAALSDLISMNRSLPDIRHPQCKKRLYLKTLPTVSVVVPFHNEHWSTLLRTAYSVINRSPHHLLKEIFLVDDASTKDFLKAKLDKYVAENLPKVKVLRIKKRSGLITARLTGAREATADVLIFLDSHTEANVNWLPPLLEPIALNYRTVVCPFIDVVAYDTFEYRAQDEGARGAFDWEFFYKRLPVLPKDEENMPEPFESPVMAGGLFAISSKFFWELGGYDPGLDIWGGEQYELSFKVWQCGGRMLDAPCSRVGHIYRKFAPFPNPGHGDFVAKNYRRVADVWMDEYAEHLYQRRPHYRAVSPGDISHQKHLREALKCKSFKWFITQVAFDLPAKYPPVEPAPFGEGHISPVAQLGLCVDAQHGDDAGTLVLAACKKDEPEQIFSLSYYKDIRVKSRKMCWDLPESKSGSPIRLYSCHLGGGNQLWRYDAEKKVIHPSSMQSCLDWSKKTQQLFINNCDFISETQQWNVEEVNQERMNVWELQTIRVTGPVETVEN